MLWVTQRRRRLTKSKSKAPSQPSLPLTTTWKSQPFLHFDFSFTFIAPFAHFQSDFSSLSLPPLSRFTFVASRIVNVTFMFSISHPSDDSIYVEDEELKMQGRLLAGKKRYLLWRKRKSEGNLTRAARSHLIINTVTRWMRKSAYNSISSPGLKICVCYLLLKLLRYSSLLLHLIMTSSAALFPLQLTKADMHRELDYWREIQMDEGKKRKIGK